MSLLKSSSTKKHKSGFVFAGKLSTSKFSLNQDNAYSKQVNMEIGLTGTAFQKSAGLNSQCLFTFTRATQCYGSLNFIDEILLCEIRLMDFHYLQLTRQLSLISTVQDTQQPDTSVMLRFGADASLDDLVSTQLRSLDFDIEHLSISKDPSVPDIFEVLDQ